MAAADVFAGWPLLNAAAREQAAENARPHMMELVAGMGATAETARYALEFVVAACQAELEAAEPTPFPQPNRSTRRRRRR